MRLPLIILCSVMISCAQYKKIAFVRRENSAITGSEFYKQAAAYGWKQRDSVAVLEILHGNVPSFLRKFAPVQTSVKDAQGKIIKATYYVSPDYQSVGSDADWARIPLTPIAAQKIADALDCFLPTRKIVNDIY